MKINKLFILLICLFMLIIDSVIAQEHIVIQNEQQVINITDKIYILEDKESKLSIQDILKGELQNKFVKRDTTISSLTNKIKSVWIKFDVKNMLGENTYLEIDDVANSYFEVYTLANDSNTYQTKKFGNLLPFNTKEVHTNLHLVSLDNAHDTLIHSFYIRFQDKSSRWIPLKVSLLKNFFPLHLEEEFFWGIFFGVVFLMSLYNLFIFLIVRERTYLYYVLHIVFSGFTTLTFAGYGFKLFWSNYPQLNQYIAYFLPSISLFFLIVFSISFLETRKYALLGHKGLFVFIFILIISVISYFINPDLVPIIVQITILLLCVYLFILSLYIYNKGNKVARFYALANGFFILGLIVLVFKRNQFLPDNFIINHSNQIGTILEILFFSFALADKIRYINKAREEAQNENIRLIEEQKETLEEKVQERTKELESANAEITTQNEELQQQQEELTIINENLENKNKLIEEQKHIIENSFKELKNTSDRLNKSIRYAYNIQQIILPKKDKLDSFFAAHFSFYMPKDVVSGDFYWFTVLDETKAIFALADCTGHGVPGAFMSMIGNTLLHEITKSKGIISPAEILTDLNLSIKNILKQEEGQNSDGMDISVCLFEKQESISTCKITFSGAKSNLFYVKENQIHQLMGNRSSIGGVSERSKEFINQEVFLDADQIIYFTSDGYIDQHNKERRRFSTNKFKELLQQIYPLDIREQEVAIRKTLKEYQQNEEQRDDISVIGIKL